MILIILTVTHPHLTPHHVKNGKNIRNKIRIRIRRRRRTKIKTNQITVIHLIQMIPKIHMIVNNQQLQTRK